MTEMKAKGKIRVKGKAKGETKVVEEVKGFKSASYVNKDHFFLKGLYKERHPNSSCMIEYEATGVSHADLQKLKGFTKRRKQKLESVEVIPSNIPHFTFGTNIDGNGRVSCSDRTGLFLIKIADGNATRNMYLLKRLIGSGKNTFVQSLYCTDFDTQKIFLRLNRHKAKASDKPKLGIFDGDVLQNPGGGAYLKYKKLGVPTPPVMHQNVVLVKTSVEKYFANKERTWS